MQGAQGIFHQGVTLPDRAMSKLSFALLTGLILGLAGTMTVQAAGTAAGTVITNQAYADYTDGNGNPLTRVYSNSVTTTVSQVAGVDVTPAIAATSAAQGTSITFAATITNTGNGDDTFALSATNANGWTTTLYLDDNGNGVLDPGETTVVTSTSSLPAEGLYRVIVKVDVPAGTANNTTSATTLTATSAFNGDVFDSGIYTINVQDAVLLTTKTIVAATGYKPGDEITYAITGRNTGSAVAQNVRLVDQIPTNTSYVIGSTRIGIVGGSYESATPKGDGVGDDGVGPDPDYNVTNPGAITVTWGDAAPEPDPSGSGVVYFKVTINANVPSGTPISNTVTVNYDIAGNPQPPQQSNTPVFQVETSAALLLGPDRSSTADPGSLLTYALTLTNNGNATDTFDLTNTSTAGLVWVYWVDLNNDGIAGNDGDYMLTDTDGDNRIETGSLPSGSSLNILAVATLPAGTSDGTVDITVVTATSNNDPTKSAQATLTTTVTAPVLTVSKTVSPTGNQPPGAVLTYTVTVTNTGTGVAKNVVISDMVPMYTALNDGSILSGNPLVPRSNAADTDGAYYDSGSNAVVTDPLQLGPGGSSSLQFSVTIQ